MNTNTNNNITNDTNDTNTNITNDTNIVNTVHESNIQNPVVIVEKKKNYKDGYYFAESV